MLDPFQFLLIAIAGWMNQRQLQVIEYLREENRVLREQLGGRRLRFNDDQRRRLEFGHFKQRRRESSACNGWCCRERQREKAVRATVAVRVSPDLGKKAGRSGDAISASLDTRWCASAHRLPNRPAIGRCRQPRPRLAAALRF